MAYGSLTSDAQGLIDLRTQLTKLWGNLEESQVQLEGSNRSRRGGRRESKQRLEDQLPPSSDPELSQDVNVQSDSEHKEALVTSSAMPNQLFSCCIRQFGKKVEENDSEKADAGEGQRWKRVFGLFGTRLTYLDTASP